MNDLRLSRLPGGAVVLTAAMPHLRSVSVGIWAGAGGRHESARLSGISHFLEHMLFKGTRRRTAKEISEAIEGVGGYLNAFTTEDHTCYYAHVGADRLGLAVDVLGDMVTRSVFDPAEVERERQVIREEILSYRDQPSQLVLEKLAAATWPSHALGRPVTGTPESVARIRRADLIAHQRRVCAPALVVFTAAGAVAHDEFVRAVAPVARRLPAARPARAMPFAGRVRPTIEVHADDTEQAHLALGFRIFGRQDRRRYALRLLNLVLGENMSSRLFQELRERRGLCYSVQSGSQLLAETGLFTVQCALDPANASRAVRLVLRECERMSRSAVSAAELRRARDAAIGQFQIGFEGASNRMTWLGESWLGYGRLADPSVIEERFREVTAEQIRHVAEAVFRRARLAFAVVGPGADPRQAAEWIGG